MSNQTALGIVITLILISAVMSTVIAEGQTLDQFKQNPTPQNFQQLSVDDQATFLGETYREDLAEKFYQSADNVGKNPAVDQQYFSKSENIGKNAEADDTFFSGSGSSATGRSNIANTKEAASVYFSKKYSSTYILEVIEPDFVFDLEKGTLTNGGKTIPFSLFKDKLSIKNIRTVVGGFVIEEEQHKTELTGVGNAEVKSYDSETGSVEMAVGDNPLTFTRETGKDLMVEVDNDGGLKLSGATKGKITQNGKEIRFQNREGALLISANGQTITADDAIVDTSELFLDGRFSVSGETIKLQSYAGKPSKVVDKKTSLGIESQGQSRDAGEAVTVHLGEINKDGTITGKNAEVWIKADQPELFVFAQGKVKVSKYITSPDGTPLAESTVSPRFTGKEASAKFDFHSQSKVEEFSLSGQALYEDRLVNIDNIQDGSEVLKKQPSPDPQTIDLFEVKCSGCTDGEVTKITKKITAIHQTESMAEISGRTFVSVSAARDLTVTFKQTAEGIVPEPDKKMLGELATQLGDDGVLSISTSMLVQTGENGFFGITPNGIGKYEREGSNLKLSEAAIDLNVRQSIGNEIVYVNDDEYDKVSQFISALEDKDFAEADKLGKELSPATKSVLEKELGIKTELLGDSGYSSHLSAGITETSGEGKSKVFAEKLRERGVNIDNTGRCVDDACTETIRKALASGTANAHLFLALLNSLDKGQIELLEAQKVALEAERKSTTEVEREISKLKTSIEQRSEDKKRFNANYEPKSTVYVFDTIKQASAELTQTLSEMSETAAVELALKIEAGEIDSYEEAILQEAEELKSKKESTEQQLKFHQGRLETARQQHEKTKKEIEVDQARAQYSTGEDTYFSAQAANERAATLSQAQKDIEDAKREIALRESNLKEINLKRNELVEQLPSRPDLQAQVYREMGDHAEEAGKRIAVAALLSGAEVQVDQSQANHMLAISLAEAGDDENALNVAEESGNPESVSIVASVINGKKAAPLVEMQSDLVNAEVRHKWERKIARDEISWVDPLLSPASAITDMGGKIKRKQAEEDMNYITRTQLEAAATIRAVSAGREVPKNDFTDSSLFKQMMGEVLTPDEKLGALLDQAKLLHHTKGIGAAEPIYQQIMKEAPDSAQAYYAHNQLEMKSLATTVEYSELAADLVIDIPMAIGVSMGIAKLATKVAKAQALARILSKAKKVADVTGDIAKTVSNAPEAAKVLPEVEKIAESSRKIEKLAEESSELGKIGDKIKSCGVKCQDEIIAAAKSAKLDDAVSAGEKAVVEAGNAPIPLKKAQQQALAGIQRAAQKKAVAHGQEMAAHADELQQSVKVLDEAVAVGDAPLAKVGEQVRVLAEEARGMAGAAKVQQAVSTPVRVAAGLKKIKTAVVGEKVVQEAVEDTSKLAQSGQRVDNAVAQGVGKGGMGIIAPVDIDAIAKNLKASISAARKSGDSNALLAAEHYLAEPAVLKAFREAGKEGELLKLQKSLGPKTGLAGAIEKVLGKAKPKKMVPQSVVEPVAHLETTPTIAVSKLPKADVSDIAKIKTGQRGVVAVGDLHGSYDNLYWDVNGWNPQTKTFSNKLIDGSPTDPSTWKWVGGDGVMVQIGDVFDRGEHAFEIRAALNRLDDEAKLTGGRVVRLMGNHELAYLQKSPVSGYDYANADTIRAMLLKDIAEGRLVAASAIDGELYTHAGVSLQKFSEWKGKTAQQIANDINQRFYAAVQTGDFSDHIFDLGKGGHSPGSKGWLNAPDQGGIFWLRTDELTSISDVNLGFKQLRGHDVIDSTKFVDEIQRYTDEAGKEIFINLDVGRSTHYGGGSGAYHAAPNAMEEVVEVSPKGVVKLGVKTPSVMDRPVARVPVDDDAIGFNPNLVGSNVQPEVVAASAMEESISVERGALSIGTPIREVITPEIPVISEVILEEGGVVIRSKNNLYFVTSEGVFDVVVDAKHYQATGKVKLKPGDMHIAYIEETKSLREQFMRILSEADKVGKVVDDAYKNKLTWLMAAQDQKITIHVADELPGMINIHGSHNAYLQKMEEISENNAVLHSLHQRFAEERLSGPRLTDNSPLVCDRKTFACIGSARTIIEGTPPEQVMGLARQWGYTGDNFDSAVDLISGNAIRYRLFADETEVQSIAGTIAGRAINDFEEARKIVAEQQLVRLAGHETYHYAYSRLLNPTQRQTWVEFVMQKIKSDPDFSGAMEWLKLKYGGTPEQLAEEVFTYRMHFHTFGKPEATGKLTTETGFNFGFAVSDEEITLLEKLLGMKIR